MWCKRLESDAEAIRGSRARLSEDELRRADGIYSAEKRDRFVIARAALRTLLSQYDDVEPSKIRFRYNAHGKPELDGAAAQSGLQFSVSHTHQLALFAFTFDRRVGLDAEWSKRKLPVQGVAARFLSPQEHLEYQQLPEGLKQSGFFAYWTRKEAFIKAIGRGLSFPVRQASILTASQSPAGLRVIAGDGQQLPGWTVLGFEPEAAYVAALAVEGPPGPLSFWRAS